MRKHAFFFWAGWGLFIVGLFAPRVATGADNFRVITSPGDLRDILKEA